MTNLKRLGRRPQTTATGTLQTLYPIMLKDSKGRVVCIVLPAGSESAVVVQMAAFQNDRTAAPRRFETFAVYLVLHNEAFP